MGDTATKTIDTKTLKSELAKKLDENDKIAASWKIEDGTVHVTEEGRKAFRQNLDEIKELRSTLEDIGSHEQLQDWASSEGKDARAAVAMMDAAGQGGPSHRLVKSIGEMFTDSDEFKKLQGGTAGANMQNPWEFKGDLLAPHKQMESKDVFTSMPAGDPRTITFGTTQRDPIVPRANRTARVRDLFPQASTSANLIDFFRVTGFVNNAGMVPERSEEGDPATPVFGLKPQSQLSFEVAQAPVRTIAHWEAAHRNVLADEPQLQAIINNELLYGLRLAEDDQILNGTGTGEDLLGILNTPGIQQYSWSEGEEKDNRADAIRRGMTRAILSNYMVTGIVTHPFDWEAIELLKNDVGDYLVAVSIAMGGGKQLWTAPVVDTPAIDEGRALLGAFGIGAQLYDRMTGTIRIAEQHADFFIRNAVVVLAEERLALATKRPESFVDVTFDNAPTSD